MKFGKQIQSQQVPGWAGMYLDYKGLKRIINSLARGSPADAAILASGLQPSSIPSTGNPSFAPPSNEPAVLQTHRAAFFFKLERELDKINEFYLSKEGELRVRLRSLIDKRKVLETRAGGNLTFESSIAQSLCEGFRMLEKDLFRLQQFMEINATGFRKILKKWDKRSKSQTKELYLARQVEVQPCFNREVIAQLADAAASNLVQLEAGRCLDHASELPNDDRSRSRENVSPATGFVELEGGSIFIKPATAHDAFDYQELEKSLLRAVSSGSSSVVSDLIRNVNATPAISPILWRAAFEIPDASSSTTLSPSSETGKATLSHFSDLVEKLDFEYVDDINSRTPLHDAALHGKYHLVQLALNKGVPAAAKDIYGRQALHYAAMNGHVDICTFLFNAGADLNVIDMDGYTPVTYAVVQGCIECLKIFLKADHSGAVSHQSTTKDGQQQVLPGLQPLPLACQSGHTEIVHILLQRDPPLNPNESGLYPQHLAARVGHVEVLKLLASHGAPMDLPDHYSSWTPLIHASSEGNIECVKFLLQAGVNAYAKDEFDKTALHYAGWQGNIDCVNTLIAATNGLSYVKPAPWKQNPSPSFVGLALNGNDMDTKSNADGIPDLALPPPILPTRLYGHSYLSQDTLVHVTLGHSFPSSKSSGTLYRPAVQLYGQSQLSSLKLVMSSKPDSYAIPHSVILPLGEERDVFPFKVNALDELSFEFDLSPTFGSRLLGRGVALSSLFSDLRNIGQYSVPLVDVHLKTIGCVNFEMTVIKPFKGVQLEIGGQIETYWKSTESATLFSRPMSADGDGGSHYAQFTGPPSEYIQTTTTPNSFITASSLIGGYVRIVVQVTSDGIPIAYPLWNIPVEGGIDVRVVDLTCEQIMSLSKKIGKDFVEPQESQIEDSRAWYQAISTSITPLSDVLECMPASIGVDLEIRYPTRSDAARLGIHYVPEVNEYVNAVLNTVYGTVTQSKGNLGRNGKHAQKFRRIVFSSFNPTICTALNWKQPNYAVFFGSYCGRSRSTPQGQLVPANRSESDRRCTSIREAVKFAASNNLLGVLLDENILAKIPSLVHSAKEHGLLVTTFGRGPQETFEHGTDGYLDLLTGVLEHDTTNEEMNI